MLNNSTKEQIEIVHNAWKTSAVINATAGSGKTTTLIETVREILKVEKFAKILIIVFNSHIAKEINDKLQNSQVVCCTLHSIGNALLNSQPQKYVFNKYLMDNKNKKYRVILNKLILGKDSHSIKNNCMNLINLGRMVDTDFNNAQEIYNLANDYQIPIVGNEIGLTSEAMVKGLQQFKQNKWTDFGDMIYLPVKLNLTLKDNYIKIGGKDGISVTQPFDYIFGDEAQDFGRIMQLLIRNFSHKNTKFLFFGDRLQAINGFCGADPYSFENLAIDYECAEYELTKTFRCPPNHVNYVNQIFNTNFTAHKTVEGLLERISSIDYEKLDKSFTILGRFRNGKEAKLWEVFFNCLAYGKDASIFGMNAFELVEKIIPENLQDDFSQLHTNLLRESAVTQSSYIDKGWKNVAADYQADVTNVLKLIEYSTATTWSNFTKWLSKISYDRENCVKISTIHTFKGKESSNIILLDSDKFPYANDKQTPLQKLQETCTHYVAVTRSLENLFLMN